MANMQMTLNEAIQVFLGRLADEKAPVELRRKIFLLIYISFVGILNLLILGSPWPCTRAIGSSALWISLWPSFWP